VKERVRTILAEIATEPRAAWPALLAARFPGDAPMVQQGLLWLCASGQDEQRGTRPPLGPHGDQRFELTVQLDSGATASVWQAFDRKLGRNVAIKILHRDETAQLILEARAACDVISDHVVRILDVHDEAPRPYIVMELIGEHDASSGELVLGKAASACRPASIAEVARWVMQVALGVHDAHARNVFHRDLKPDNVLITPLSRHARIADFGLAVSAANEDSGPTSSLVTRTSAGPISVSGTPEFMAPEQARGLPLHLDPRISEDRAVLVGIDVWGLGALAYDLLAGRPPWVATSDREAWEIAASGDRPPALDRTPWGERIPSRLRRIVERALAADPHDRYHSAVGLAKELEAFLAKRPTSFDRAGPVRLALWCSRNPQLTLTGLLAAILVALTLGTRATVSRLRAERDNLDETLANQRLELSTLTSNVAWARRSLGDMERRLTRRGSELAKMEKTLDLERTSSREVLEATELALAEATATSRRLADQLELARAESVKQQTGFEHELDTAAKERERARTERDKARAERDAAKQARDAALAERDDSRRALQQLQAELARLSGATTGERDRSVGTGQSP
jgi:serine/threonine protein kinase